MNSYNIIQGLLYTPVILLLIILAISYIGKGYKKGFLRSLLSLIATIIATAGSLFITKSISHTIAGALVANLPSEFVMLLSDRGSLGFSIAQGFIDVALSFLFFCICFPICLAILKYISQSICSKKAKQNDTAENPQITENAQTTEGAQTAENVQTIEDVVITEDVLITEVAPSEKDESIAENAPSIENIQNEENNKRNPFSRFMGVLIRSVDAVLVTIMLLLPLYGTLATAAPPVASLLKIGETAAELTSIIDRIESFQSMQPSGTTVVQPESEETDISETLDIVAAHPTLLPYKYGPGAWAYSYLSSFSINGNKVDVASTAASLEELLSMMQAYITAIQSGDSQTAADITQELIDYLRSDVINQQWSYNLLMAAMSEMNSMVVEHTEEYSHQVEFAQIYEQLQCALTDMTYEEYIENAEGLLDFASWFTEMYGKHGDALFTDEELLLQEKDLYLHMGNLLNQSEQMVNFKRGILKIYADKMYAVLPDINDPANADYYTGREDLPNSGEEFVDKYFGEGVVSEEDRINEAYMFLSLFDSYYAVDVAEAFVRHPLFGADAVIESMDENLYINGIGDEFGQSLADSYNSERNFKRLDNILRDYEDAPLDQPFEFNNDLYEYIVY